MAGQVSDEPPRGSTDDEEDRVPPIGGIPSTYRPSKPLDFFFNPFKPPTQEEVTNYLTPRYLLGDEGKPASWGEERIIELQSQMVDAGVLKANKYQRGVWDYSSREAYQRLLEMANAAGTSVDTALANYRQMAAKYGRPEDAESPRQPLVTTRKDPESLRALLGAVATRTMAGALTREEEDRFIATFNQMSDEAQRQEYIAKGSGGPGGPGGTVTDVDPEAQASKFIRESRPQDVVKNDVFQRFDAFQNLLSKYQ